MSETVVSNPSAGADHRAPAIVVGIDGSTESEQALLWACSHASAEEHPREVMATCVRTISPLPDDLIIGTTGWDEDLDDPDDPDNPVRAMLDEMAEHVCQSHPGLTILRQVLRGHPAHELIRLSGTTDLMVVGASGHGAFTGMVLGSVSQQLLTHSRCTVAVVR